MTHDPLCPNFHLEDDCTCKPRNGEHDLKCACWDCECDIIAKVRADTLARCVKMLDDHHPRCTDPCELCAEWDGMRKDLKNLVGQP